MRSEQDQGFGPLIASIIIVAILLVGGYYSFQTSGNLQPDNGTPPGNITGQPLPAISAPAEPPQESTEIGDIEADTNAVDVGEIDSGLDNLDLLVQQ